MRQTPKAFLGGFPLLRSQHVSWVMTEGARPNIQVFSLRPNDARQLLRNAKYGPVDLELNYKNRQVKIEKLYVLYPAPPDNPHVSKVVVADRRCWWSNRIIYRDYNIRRNDGVIRFVDQGAPQETAITSPIVRYWPWSLKFAVNNSYATWKVSETFEDIIEEALTVEKDKFGVNIPTEYFPKGGKDKTDKVDFENITIPGDGADAALERIKSMSPAVGIKLRPNGAVVVFRKDDDMDVDDATWGMGAPIDGGGIIIKGNNSLLRPGKIIVRMEREVEIRLDSVEERRDNGQTVADPDLEHRGMWNVGQVTDPYLLLGSEKYPQGTWMTMRDLIRLFPSRAGKRLSERAIRECLIPFGPDLWQRLQVSSFLNPNVEWGARISMIQNCYRRTFQVHWKYLSRIRSLRAYRIATVNQSTGARAPASVYSDYSTIPSMRGAMQGQKFDAAAGFAEENFGLGVADTVAFTDFKCWAPLIKDCRPTPAFVRILDADQGIILIDYQLSLMGMDMSIYPGLITPNPTLDIRFQDNGAHMLTTDSVTTENAEHPALSDTYRLSVIMSAVPAAPNNRQKLHAIEITPSMIEQKYGVKLGECNGPDMELFVGPNVNTAKVAWQDDRADDIDLCFGLGGSALPNLKGLVINESESNARVGASIQGTALGAAAQIYMTLVDRPIGQQEGLLTQAQEIEGWKDKVTHSLSPGGKLRTGVSMMERLPRINLSEYLDSNLRRAILQLAQPPT